MENWRDLGEADLDDAYANAAHIADAGRFPAHWRDAALAFRQVHSPEVLTYGSGPAERVDLFHPSGPPRGLIVFLHGGYWRAFGRSDWSHLAAGGLAAGHAVAIPSYPLAPAARIGAITRHVARAVDAAASRIPGPIRLTGHSAGGQLCARLVMPDAAPASVGRIAACVPISPLADLCPLLPQSQNADWRLDPAEAARESPALGLPRPGPAIAIHVGAGERPSFLWQARRLADAWGVPLRQAAGRHHFDVIDALCDRTSALMADLLA